MTTNQWLQILFYFGALLALALPLGAYMAKVYENKPFFLSKWLGWLERLVYRLCGVKPEEEMDWKSYALAMLLFNIVGGLILYAIERFQASLPLNPAGQSAVPPDLAFNTAISFITNTNWQFYGGETTMSYLTQMAGLAVHNFLCAACSGMATLVALIRGLVRKETKFLGNFWADMTRGTLYILLPLSFLFALVLIQQGAPQTFSNNATATLLQPTSYDQPVTTSAGVPGDVGRQTPDDPCDGDEPVHRPGARGFPGSHQDAGHQRRGLFQRELGSPLREPHALHGSPRAPGHSLDTGGSLLHLWDHGEGHEAGLGHLGCHVPAAGAHALPLRPTGTIGKSPSQ